MFWLLQRAVRVFSDRTHVTLLTVVNCKLFKQGRPVTASQSYLLKEQIACGVSKLHEIFEQNISIQGLGICTSTGVGGQSALNEASRWC